MTFLQIITLVLFIINIVLLNIRFSSYRDNDFLIRVSDVIIIVFIVFLCLSIGQIYKLRATNIFLDKQKQQIEYQIENLNENSDTIKINEWILKYNDKIIEIETSKESLGKISYYYTLNIDDHKVMKLI